MPVTDVERALSASARAHLSWANTQDRTSRTAAARAALERTFLDAADGDPVRAAHLRQAHYKLLALKSVQSRRKARESEEVAAESELSLMAGQGA